MNTCHFGVTVVVGRVCVDALLIEKRLDRSVNSPFHDKAIFCVTIWAGREQIGHYVNANLTYYSASPKYSTSA